MSGASISPAWIALDWGTTRLRAWAMDAGGSVLAEADSDDGMAALTPEGFEPALLALVGGWLPEGKVTQVIACGMVGARQGWIEAPYAAVPCKALPEGLVQAPARDPRLDLRVIPGLSQDDPADVMRGEETQIAGFLALNPNWDGVICLPGTHGKWAQVSAGEVVSFTTCMTGDLFAAISGHTVLRHSIAAEGWDDAAFDAALAETLARPEKLAQRLFSLRAEGLLKGLDGASARARLSGLLIGAELAATRPYWLGQQLAVLGEGALARLYLRALAAQFAPATQAESAAMTRAGLTAARRRLQGDPA